MLQSCILHAAFKKLPPFYLLYFKIPDDSMYPPDELNRFFALRAGKAPVAMAGNMINCLQEQLPGWLIFVCAQYCRQP